MIDRRAMMMAAAVMLVVGIPASAVMVPENMPHEPEISAQAWKHIGSSLHQRKSGPNFNGKR